MTQALILAGNASTCGSWQVVGNSGALAVHAVPTTSDIVLFMQRPNNRNGSGDDPYLTVRPFKLLEGLQEIMWACNNQDAHNSANRQSSGEICCLVPTVLAELAYCLRELLIDLKVENGTQTEIAAIYNMTDNTFKPYHIREHPFCGAHTLLPDGNAIIVGGVSHSSAFHLRIACICI